MADKIKIVLNIIILILAGVNCVLNIIGGNYGLSAIWGGVSILNTVAVILMLRQKK